MRFPTILATLTTAVFAHEGHNHNPAAAEMNEAATVFLASLLVLFDTYLVFDLTYLSSFLNSGR